MHCAEEIIFGKQKASIGRSNDREMASMLAVDFIRKYGFDEEYQAVYTLDFAYMLNKFETDKDIEKMMTRLVNETHELLVKNQPCLKALSNLLCSKGSLESKEVADLAKDFGLEVTVKGEGFLKIEDYKNKMEK